MTIGTDDLGRITQQTAVISADGDRLGTINQIYTSDTTGDPAWVTLKTGLFGTQESFVPLSDASFDGDDIKVAVTKEAVHGAPRVDADGHLSAEEEDGLYRHYGLDNPGETDPDVGREVDEAPQGEDHADAPGNGSLDYGDDRDRRPHEDTHEAAAGAGAAAAAAAAVPDEARDDELAQRDAEGRDEVAEAPVASPRRAQDDDDSSAVAEDEPVKPGERTTRLRRYVVTERVVQTIEELPDEPER